MTPLQIAQFVLYCIFGLFTVVTTLVMGSWGLSKIVHGKKEGEKEVAQSDKVAVTHAVELVEVQVTLSSVEKRIEAVLNELKVLNAHDSKITVLEGQLRETREEVAKLREWRHGAANDIMGHLSRLSLYVLEHSRTSSLPDGASGVNSWTRSGEVKR